MANQKEENLQKLWDEEAANRQGEPADDVDLQAGGDEKLDDLQNAEPAAQAAENQQNTQTQEAPPADPFEGLPDAVKLKLQELDKLKADQAQLLHHLRSAEGRVAAMQREFQAARAAQQSVAPQNAPTQGQIAAATKNPEKWDQLKADFPDWAEAMEEFVAAKLAGIKPSQSGVQANEVVDYVQRQLGSTKAEIVRAVEEARVEGKYDNWRELVATPEFANWFSQQPEDVKALANSTKGRDAIRMLDLYSSAKARSASGVRQERGQRLAVAASTKPGQTPPPKGVENMSAAELWAYEARLREKRKAQQGF